MYTLSTQENRFQLQVQHSHPAVGGLLRLFRGSVERALAFPQLNEINAAAECRQEEYSAEDRILRAMRVGLDVDGGALERIPDTGPLIVVANHPFGGVEGLLLASLLHRRRTDVRIMANRMLGHIPSLRDLFILVNPFGGELAVRSNSAPLKEALRWLGEGGVLGVFPAGEVSHADVRRGEISDPAWSDTIARIAMHSGAAVLPIFIEGCNGPLFQLMGLLHPRLRTARLPHEFVNKCDSTVTMRIGHVISPTRIRQFKTSGDLIAYLRIRTYLQRSGSTPAPLMRSEPLPEAVVDAADKVLLRHEISALPESALLVQHERFGVYIADARDIPVVLREIGRLREITFRANNEGTGRSIDLDRYDAWYLHLFLWDETAGEIAAAYRLGPTDVILREHGKKGLYTHSLFNIRKKLLKQISPALEMGRSFVRQEYQKQFLPLLLLWRGIGTYVRRNPRYTRLFGPVSINSAYSAVSQKLMMEFLKEHAMDERAHLVRPKTPPNAERLRGFDPRTMSTVLRDLSDLSSLVSEIEQDQKDVPILLKQYLKLGGVLLGFNIDPDFSNVLDGLILVDLTKTDRRMLERYMGAEGADAFLRHCQ
ncbi:MAG: lysophospholipid acyltransferase family protein [Bacteroidia bacterium]|nr:lysophospholipid acyltransferase family protein [Bacteroidia bacterium]